MGKSKGTPGIRALRLIITVAGLGVLKSALIFDVSAQTARSPEDGTTSQVVDPTPTPNPTSTPTPTPAPPACSLSASRIDYTDQCQLTLRSTGGPVVTTSTDTVTQANTSSPTTTLNGPWLPFDGKAPLVLRVNCQAASQTKFVQRVKGPAAESACEAVVPAVLLPTCSIEAERLASDPLKCKVTLTTELSGSPIQKYRLDRWTEVKGWQEGLQWIPGQYGTQVFERGCRAAAHTLSAWGFGPAGGVSCGKKEIPPIPAPSCTLRASRIGETNRCAVSLSLSGGPVNQRDLSKQANSGSATTLLSTVKKLSLAPRTESFEEECPRSLGTTFSASLVGLNGTTATCSSTVTRIPQVKCQLQANRIGTSDRCLVSLQLSQGTTTQRNLSRRYRSGLNWTEPAWTSIAKSSNRWNGPTETLESPCKQTENAHFSYDLVGTDGETVNCYDVVPQVPAPTCSLTITRPSEASTTCTVNASVNGFSDNISIEASEDPYPVRIPQINATRATAKLIRESTQVERQSVNKQRLSAALSADAGEASVRWRKLITTTTKSSLRTKGSAPNLFLEIAISQKEATSVTGTYKFGTKGSLAEFTVTSDEVAAGKKLIPVASPGSYDIEKSESYWTPFSGSISATKAQLTARRWSSTSIESGDFEVEVAEKFYERGIELPQNAVAPTRVFFRTGPPEPFQVRVATQEELAQGKIVLSTDPGPYRFYVEAVIHNKEFAPLNKVFTSSDSTVGTSSGEVTCTKRLGSETSYTVTVKGPGGNATCTATENIDSCGRSRREKHYGNPDCCVDTPPPPAEELKEYAWKGTHQIYNRYENWTAATPRTVARVCIKQAGGAWGRWNDRYNGRVNGAWILAGTEIQNVGSANAKGEYCYRCAVMRIDGCFVPETKILMADGSQKKLEDLSAGELVVSGKTGAPIAIKSLLESNEDKPIIAVSIGKRRVRVTQKHPFPTARGWMAASDLKVGDKIREPDGRDAEVTSIEELPIIPSQRVLNMQLATESHDYDDHLLVADGIVTGDLFVQQSMAQAERD